MRFILRSGLLISIATAVALTAAQLPAEETMVRHTGPWNMANLKKVPAAAWREKSSLVEESPINESPINESPADKSLANENPNQAIRVEEVYYEGEPLDQVDPERIGITGISWGGYLTCIVAGIDDRLKVAVPVYGCGFLDENSAWVDLLHEMPPELRDRWIACFDPSRYLDSVTCPILFVNGTNDFAYPLDSYRKSYRQVPGRADLRIEVAMRHSHPHGWAPQEIGLFVDSVLKSGDPLCKLGPMKTAGGKVFATIDAEVPVVIGHIHYTIDGGKWQERNWHTVRAQLADDRVTAELPAAREIVYYLSVTDRRGAMVSTEHAELPSDASSPQSSSAAVKAAAPQE